MKELYYFKKNLILEPLINHWYAWPHLISPATAAMNVIGRHIKIMQSFLRAPEVHFNAAKNPEMLGGPFINLSEENIPFIEDLLKKTIKHSVYYAQFFDDIKFLNKLLKENAQGDSLVKLYQLIPDTLKGYVELVYDLNNQPSFRLIESLLYESVLYDESLQAIRLSLMEEDERPFILSTPIFEGIDNLYLNISFKDNLIDSLCKLKYAPKTFDEIVDLLSSKLNNKKINILKSFLTTDKPQLFDAIKGEFIRWRYFGHACILIESNQCNVLIDPVLSYDHKKGIKRYSFQELPEFIDFVLLTHNHQDHVVLETLLQIRHKIGCLIVPKSSGGNLQDPSLKLMLNRIGFSNLLEIGELESIIINRNDIIIGIPFLGEHSDLDIRSKITYLIKINGYNILFAADTCNIEPQLYKNVQKIIGNIDTLFLGMECDGAPLSWLYGPLLTQPMNRNYDQSRRLAGSNHKRAIELVKCFNCKEVYVYAMGQEPWLNYIMSIKYSENSDPILESNKLVNECLSRGIIAERLFGQKEKIINLRLTSKK